MARPRGSQGGRRALRRPASDAAFGGSPPCVLAIVVGAAVLGWRAIGASLGDAAARCRDAVRGRGPRLRAHRRYVARRRGRRCGSPASRRPCPDRRANPPTPPRGVAMPRAPRWRWRASLRQGPRTCKLGSEDDDGRRFGTCHTGEKDVAAELVRGGHVFATSGYLHPMARSRARRAANKAGVWGGEAARPADYRAQKWEEAKREAPDGCPIKGNVKGGRRDLYVCLGRKATSACASAADGRPLVLQRIRGTASRLEALRAVLSGKHPFAERESPRSGGRARAAMRDAA